MTRNDNDDKPFTFRLTDTEPGVFLELTNWTDRTLKSVDILTIFLKDEETPGGGPSQSHIRFDTVTSMPARQTAVLAHRTWINGKPAGADCDQLERLRVIAGKASPYVLDLSWENEEGKSRFQRIPIGH